jgi:hypothetical protein
METGKMVWETNLSKAVDVQLTALPRSGQDRD